MHGLSLLAKNEIAFIDPAVSNREMLLQSLRDQIHAIVLEPSTDALDQMVEALVGRSRLKALHILANGRPGEVRFSSGSLSVRGILQRQKDLAAIGAALDRNGEILLWSSMTGAGSLGDRFVEALSWATGALVDAASGSVGASAQSGQWELDTTVGAIVVPPPVSSVEISADTGLMSGAPVTSWSLVPRPIRSGAAPLGTSIAPA